MTRPFLPEVTETTEAIRVAWDMRRAPRDGRHLRTLLWLGPLLAACGTVPACLTFRPSEGANWLERIIALVFGAFWWLFVAVIGYDLVGRRWAEWVEVSSTAITVGRRGFLAPKPTVIPIRRGVELFLGRYEDGDGPAPRPSLEVLRPSPWGGGQSRTEFGRWLTEPAREQVFQTLAAFIAARNIPITVTRTLT